jgi:hypothetical protein
VVIAAEQDGTECHSSTISGRPSRIQKTAARAKIKLQSEMKRHVRRGLALSDTELQYGESESPIQVSSSLLQAWEASHDNISTDTDVSEDSLAGIKATVVNPRKGKGKSL